MPNRLVGDRSDFSAVATGLGVGIADPIGHGPATAEDVRAARALALDPNISVLHGTLLSLVRRDGRDLTARQLTAFLTVYMEERTHTVSSLADLLHISRPGVTRIMDRLVQFDLLSREEDREDRRRVLVRRTTRGTSFFRELVGMARGVAASQHASAA